MWFDYLAIVNVAWEPMGITVRFSFKEIVIALAITIVIVVIGFANATVMIRTTHHDQRLEQCYRTNPSLPEPFPLSY
jgi:hypothetical protein